MHLLSSVQANPLDIWEDLATIATPSLHRGKEGGKEDGAEEGRRGRECFPV